MEFFDSLPPLLKTFWFIAIPCSIVFAIQTILTFIGADATDGIEADFDGDLQGADAPFQVFSLRNLINFLLGFGWTGISFFGLIQNPIVLILVSLGVGISFVYFFFLIIRQIQKLAEDNSFQIQNTLQKSADVYLSIPAQKMGKGKVLISVKGAVHELDAMTEGERIETGKTVRVVKIDQSILIVEPF